MKRLIDADALIERLKDECADCEEDEEACDHCSLLWTLNLIDEMPAVKWPRIGHWELELVPPKIGSDALEVTGKCSVCGCTDAVKDEYAMGRHDGVKVIWGGFITNYAGHEEVANRFALNNAEGMPKRAYCPECGAWMREETDDCRAT